MSQQEQIQSPDPYVKSAPIPRTFMEYVRSMGPGIVVVLTWLGAGDLVDASVAGGTYGYALMWALALALVIRWLFVSIIAKYQLCNQHGESVLQGLKRLHPFFPPFIFVATIVMSHVIGIYMYQGLAESCRALAARAGLPDFPAWSWAIFWGILFALLMFRPVFKRIEVVFLVFLALLTVSLLGAAAWAGPDWRAILAGTIGFEIPQQRGSFEALLVVNSLIGAVAGSLANLMYPYFIRAKGWNTPAHRKVQLYDLGFGVLAMIVLDLAVWVLGAEVLAPRHAKVESFQQLADLLSQIGALGPVLFYLGVFAAVGSSIAGNALGYGYLATDAYLLWRPQPGANPDSYRQHPVYRGMVVWVLFSPLVWVFGGTGNFVALTVTVNALQVLLLPFLAGGLWAITASARYIGPKYRNRLWENLLMGGLCVLALWSTYGVISQMARMLGW